MPEEKQDLRVQKTQRALMTAMFTLLESTPFSKITVNDICTEAMVSRSAFYVHYEDKYALIRACMETLHERLFEETKGMAFKEHVRMVLEKIKADARTFRNLVMSELDYELIEMLSNGFQKRLDQLIEEKHPDCAPAMTDVMAVYYASGITNAIVYWIGRKTSYTVDEMTECLCALLPPI